MGAYWLYPRPCTITHVRLTSPFAYLWRHYKCRKDPAAYFRAQGVRLGKNGRFFGVQPNMFGSEPYLVEIGDNYFITDGVRFITHDGSCLILRQKHPDIDVIAPIKIGSNVFIGMNSLILAGVTIGDNVIIGAGSVVTKDVESGWVVAGVPAKKIKTVEEFEKQALQRSLNCKRMSPEDKRAFLIDRYVEPTGGFKK